MFSSAFKRKSSLYQVLSTGLWTFKFNMESIGMNLHSLYPQVSLKNGSTIDLISLNLYSAQSTVLILVTATTIEVTPRHLASKACSRV